MARKYISNDKLTGSFSFRFAFKPTPARVPSFISASNIRLKIANLTRKRETFDAISLSFKISDGPLSPLHLLSEESKRNEVDGWVLFHHESANSADNLV